MLVGGNLNRVRAGVAIVVAIVVAVVAVVVAGSSVGAITNRGPTDPMTRYALEYSSTTNAPSLTVPIYFSTQPTGPKTVNASNFYRNTSTGQFMQVRFNGGPAMHANGSFTVPAASFSREPSSGLWKATINATMTGYSTLHFNNHIHFTLTLADASGYIGHGGGGFFQAAAADYPAENTWRTYNLYMATPCDVTTNTTRNIEIYDLDHRNYDNRYADVVVNIYRVNDDNTETLIIQRRGIDYPTAMGQNETLTIEMVFEPTMRYRVELTGISSTNVIQYDFPYDNIAYITRCPWTATPSVQYQINGGPWTSTTTGVQVGDRIVFRHQITNNGPSPTNRTVVGTTSGSSLMPAGSVPGSFNMGRGTAFNGGSGWQTGGEFTVTNAMLGAGNICQALSITPTGPNGTGTNSSNACFTVLYNPDIRPQTNGPTDVLTPGATTLPGVTSSLVNSQTPNGEETRAGAAVFVVKRGESVRTEAGTGTTSSADGFTCRLVADPIAINSQNCRLLAPERTFPTGTLVGTVNLWGPDASVDISSFSGLSLGDQVCVVTVVNRYISTASDSDWRHSIPICRMIAKIPKAQVSGADLRVRSDPPVTPTWNKLIRGASYTVDSNRYGSWAEYGVFGPDTIDLYSAGAIARGAGINPNKNNLTFANNTTPVGQFAWPGVQTIFDPGSYGIDTSQASINGSQTFDIGVSSNISTPNRVYKVNGAKVDITGGTVNTGTYVIDNRGGGTVNILGDIRYNPSGPTRLADLPQIIIIADNITIAPGVTHIDAWLIATNRIITCSGSGSESDTSYFHQLNSETCTNKLRVNGIIQANRLYLRRTAGYDGGVTTDQAVLGSPAESLNARADIYLWAQGRAAAQGVVRTESITELPPRF